LHTHHNALGLASALRPVQPVTLIRPHAARRAARFFVEKFPGRSLYAVKANPSPDLLQILWESGVTHYDVASIAEVRLVSETLPDATLCFIGYDMRHMVTPALLDAFARIATQVPAHVFTIERITYWPQSGAVVALPHRCDALQALCDGTRDAIRGQRIRPLQVTTQPHVTLAYLDKHLPAQPWLDSVECKGAPVRVDGFELLYNPGGRYECLASWPLTGIALATPPRQAQLL